MGHVRVGSKYIHGSPAAKVFKVAGLIILGIIGAAALAILFGLVIQWLWNALMPEIFGLPEVSYWQAVGIVVLSHILFGGHHSHDSGPKRRKSCKTVHEGNHIHIETSSKDNHYDSFREFWNDHGRDAFDKWLNRSSDSTEE